jgi:hypothetical protein
MKGKAMLISIAALLVLAAPALAQNLGSYSGKPVIETFGILGKGIATLSSDPMNFKIVTAGVAKVKVPVNGTDAMVTIGILTMDDQKYRIKDVVMGNGSVSGNLYLNDSQVGSISLSSVMKGNMEIWAGTITADGTSYNAYVLEGSRPVNNQELKEKITDYCNETGNCSQGTEAFCQSNPTDTRCLALFKAFCLRGNNMDDSRCRQYMLDWCKDRNETDDCRAFAIQRSGAYCEAHSGMAVCKAIEQKIANFTTGAGNYCANNSGTIGCAQFCRGNPGSCAVQANREQACTNSGGTVTNATCCKSATDFPNTCLIGACGCSAENSKEVKTCDCGEGRCFNGMSCINQSQEPSMAGLGAGRPGK